jgi:hypothetical protein
MTKASWIEENCDRSIAQSTVLEKYFENLSKAAQKMIKLLMRCP